MIQTIKVRLLNCGTEASGVQDIYPHCPPSVIPTAPSLDTHCASGIDIGIQHSSDQSSRDASAYRTIGMVLQLLGCWDHVLKNDQS